jgi:hypothetical protein
MWRSCASFFLELAHLDEACRSRWHREAERTPGPRMNLPGLPSTPISWNPIYHPNPSEPDTLDLGARQRHFGDTTNRYFVLHFRASDTAKELSSW